MSGAPAWVRWRPSDQEPRVRLLCFPHAGGGASMFRPWAELVPPSVRLGVAHLPGREERQALPPYRRMAPLVDALVEAIEEDLRPPFAFYGHSMGARISFALAHALAALQLPMPQALFLAGTPAPSSHDWKRGHALPEDELIAYLDDLGGLPGPIRAEPELLRRMLGCVRADLEVAEVDPLDFAEPLDCAVHAFAGEDDPLATPERVWAWRSVTRGEFRCHVLPGGHFFVQTALPAVVSRVAAALGTFEAQSVTAS